VGERLDVLEALEAVEVGVLELEEALSLLEVALGD
jgi:hypothetical protein